MRIGLEKNRVLFARDHREARRIIAGILGEKTEETPTSPSLFARIITRLVRTLIMLSKLKDSKRSTTKISKTRL